MRITSVADLGGISTAVGTITGIGGGDYDTRQLLTASGSVTVKKGWLYINASGGGGGGASGGSTQSSGGGGGGSGLSCFGAKIWIPDTRTLNITVGTAGAQQATQNTAGNNGGATVIGDLPTSTPSNNATSWTLYGGGGGLTTSFGVGAKVPRPTSFDSTTYTATKFNTYGALPENKGVYSSAGTGPYDYNHWGGGSRGGIWFSMAGTAGGTNAETSAFLWVLPHPLWHDVYSYMGSTGSAYAAFGGIGGHSLFGKGGNGSIYTGSATPSAAGQGYGAGGGGGRGGLSSDINYGQAGSPGFFECWQ